MTAVGAIGFLELLLANAKRSTSIDPVTWKKISLAVANMIHNSG